MLETISTNLSSLISLLLHSLNFSSLFPAFIFVLLNESLLLPLVSKYKPLDFTDASRMTPLVFLTLVLTILIGYILRTQNFSIITLFEGYPLRNTWFGRLMTLCQRSRRSQLMARTKELNAFVKEKMDLLDQLPDEFWNDPECEKWIESLQLIKIIRSEVNTYEQKLHFFFPPHESTVNPTDLGNAIASFEQYPKRCYGINAVFLWPRLIPILSQEGYAIFVEKEKASLDFLLNLSLLTGVFAVECVFFRLCGARISVLIPGIALLSSYLLYKGSIQSACNWGNTIRAAFDSYRYHLARQLALKPFHNSREELDRWQAISRLITADEKSDAVELTGLFDYPLPKGLPTKEEKRT